MRAEKPPQQKESNKHKGIPRASEARIPEERGYRLSSGEESQHGLCETAVISRMPDHRRKRKSHEDEYDQAERVEDRHDAPFVSLLSGNRKDV
jgi:hypothetical protein